MSVMPNAIKRYKLILKILAISPKNQLASVRIEVKMFMAFDITIISRFIFISYRFFRDLIIHSLAILSRDLNIRPNLVPLVRPRH